jgi:hypothetical protein
LSYLCSGLQVQFALTADMYAFSVCFRFMSGILEICLERICRTHLKFFVFFLSHLRSGINTYLSKIIVYAQRWKKMVTVCKNNWM